MAVASGELRKEIVGEAVTWGVDGLLDVSTEPNSYNLISYDVAVTMASEDIVESNAWAFRPLIASVLFPLVVGVLG